jgi:D-glycero-D-manno-heptose 1,7-bisphosphate phosphatase
MAMIRIANRDAGRGGARHAAAAIFLDKDGTLIEDVPYNVDPELVTLSFGAGRALARLAREGFRLIVVSNQSGIGDGRFEAAALAAVEQRIRELLAPWSVSIDAFYYCPHTRSLGCSCRKPSPELLLRAAAEHRLELHWSWLVGDILDDVEAGRRAGCRTVLLANGNETQWKLASLRVPHVLASTLPLAARCIVAAQRASASSEEACDALAVG